MGLAATRQHLESRKPRSPRITVPAFFYGRLLMEPDQRLAHFPFRVRAYEAGAAGHISVVTLCDYLQEAAGLHATALGFDRVALTPGRPPAGVWVLRRLRLEATYLPVWRETVTVETWASGNDGLRAHREFIVTNEAGAQITAATSVWFVIDPQRRRPARLGDRLDGLQRPDRPRPFEDPGDPPGPIRSPDLAVPFTVRRADLDQNGHANHARFVEWAIETVPDTFASSHTCMGFDLLVENEAHAGDEVEAVAAREEDGWVHQLRRAATSLARVRTRWRRIDDPGPATPAQ